MHLHLKDLLDLHLGLTVFNTMGALVTALVISFIAGWKLTLVILCFTPLMIFTGIIQGQQLSNASGNKKASTSDAEDGGKVRLFIYLDILRNN